MQRKLTVGFGGVCAAGPYLFTGGADKCIQLYRIPIFLNYTPEKAKDKVQTPWGLGFKLASVSATSSKSDCALGPLPRGSL